MTQIKPFEANGAFAPVPANETERLDFLHGLNLDLSNPFEEIQGLCEVASRVASTPIALVSLVDEREQNFLASVGLGNIRKTDRDIAFCAHAIMGSHQLEVPDALLDPRFSENPLVVGDPGVRSYLGTVLEPDTEMRVGTLCVIDTKPHAYSEEVKACLSRIGMAITALLVGYREKRDLVHYSDEVRRQNARMTDLTTTLQNSMTKLLAAEKAKSEFLSVVSHELRTPLTSIMGSLGLMKSSGFTADSQKSDRLVSIAYSSSERLLSLVNDILQLQKGDFANLETEFVPVDLSELVETAAHVYRNYAADKGVTLTVAGTGQPCIVNGDKTQLDRVLANILSNAFKFSRPNGNVEMTLQCLAGGPQIAVKDQGVGIPEGSEEIVFGLFSQVDNSDTRAQNGTGLGMYICKQILQQHNATIQYESEPGVGTTFRVNFPKRVNNETGEC